VKRHFFFPGVLLLLTAVLAAAQDHSRVDQPVNVAGNWQLSWEARIGTERANVHFQQDGANLTGVFHGPLGSPTVSGTVQGKNVTFTLEFSGKYPFTLTFTGPVEGDKMSGKFGVGGVDTGYDPQGENARPTDYSWKATRIPDQEGQSAKDEKSDKTTQPASR
jgi:hypothetical protein